VAKYGDDVKPLQDMVVAFDGQQAASCPALLTGSLEGAGRIRLPMIACVRELEDEGISQGPPLELEST
jgi:hypothetical protein